MLWALERADWDIAVVKRVKSVGIFLHQAAQLGWVVWLLSFN